jgi:hypothetical protein
MISRPTQYPHAPKIDIMEITRAYPPPFPPGPSSLSMVGHFTGKAAMHELAVQGKHAPGPSSPRKDSIAEPPLSTDGIAARPLSTDGIADSFESNRNNPSHYSASRIHDELYSSTIRIDSCPTLFGAEKPLHHTCTHHSNPPVHNSE